MPATMKEVLEAYETESRAVPQRWEALPLARWEGTLEFFGNQRPAAPMAWGFPFDIVHHREQISTYLRPMGQYICRRKPPNKGLTLRWSGWPQEAAATAQLNLV